MNAGEYVHPAVIVGGTGSGIVGIVPKHRPRRHVGVPIRIHVLDAADGPAAAAGEESYFFNLVTEPAPKPTC